VLSRKLSCVLSSAVVIALGVALSSTAAPINGTLELSVSGGMIDTDAHRITGGAAVVSDATGDFSFLQNESIVLNTLDYQAFSGDAVLWDADDLDSGTRWRWRNRGKLQFRRDSVIAVTATATSLSVINEENLPQAGQVILAGGGIITATGYDPTAMNWQMIATGSDEAILYVSFVSEGDEGGGGAGTPSAPEPGAALCFAVGLAVVGWSLRRRH
jgi:hypothetical protein